MYQIELSRVAIKDLERISRSDKNVYRRVISALDDISLNPKLGKALLGILKGSYSYRVGVYRIIYTIEYERLVINVIDIGHRREVYR